MTDRETALLVKIVNRLLQQCRIPQRVSELQDFSPSMFILIFENMFRKRIPDINRTPATESEHQNNLSILIKYLEQHMFHGNEFLINSTTPVGIFSRNQKFVAKFVNMFVEMGQFVKEYISKKKKLKKEHQQHQQPQQTIQQPSIPQSDSTSTNNNIVSTSQTVDPMSQFEYANLIEKEFQKSQKKSKKLKKTLTFEDDDDDNVMDEEEPHLLLKEDDGPVKSTTSLAKPKPVIRRALKSALDYGRITGYGDQYLSIFKQSFASSKKELNLNQFRQKKHQETLTRQLKTTVAMEKRQTSEEETIFKSEIQRRKNREDMMIRKLGKRIYELEKEELMMEKARNKEILNGVLSENEKKILRIENDFNVKLNLLKENLGRFKKEKQMMLNAKKRTLEVNLRELKMKRTNTIKDYRERYLQEEDARYYNQCDVFEKKLNAFLSKNG